MTFYSSKPKINIGVVGTYIIFWMSLAQDKLIDAVDAPFSKLLLKEISLLLKQPSKSYVERNTDKQHLQGG